MRKVLKIAGVLLLAILTTGSLCGMQAESEGAEANEYIIDVVDNAFISGGYSLPLDGEVNRPIEISYVEGKVHISVSSPDELVEIDLDEGHITLTDRAVSYVREAGETYIEESLFSKGEICDICGRSTAIGNHSVLPCGHQGCMVTVDHLNYCGACGRYKCDGKDHTVCEHCEVNWCVHVDLECEYTRNPAPTKAPYTLDTSGQYVEGSSGKSKAWTPAEDQLKKEKKEANELSSTEEDDDES